ncbi:hypothetical protein CLAIMM_14605 [Cladophialophora immunda]|nr:hypothetical protein CLAIMM_14605 [Cladophialophora immunda]
MPLPTFLLQPPKRWTPEQVQTLQTERSYVPTGKLRIAEFLPPDGNEGKSTRVSTVLSAHTHIEFEELAAEFVLPTKEHLLEFAQQRSRYRNNRFHPFFVRIYDATKSNSSSQSYRRAISDLLDILLSNASAARTLALSLQREISFRLPSGAGGVLDCPTISDSTGLPLTTSLIVSSTESTTRVQADEVAQALMQGYVAHSLDPTRDSYDAFVLRLSDNLLQLQETIIPSDYLTELYSGKSNRTLRVSYSDDFDLQERYDRREALRVILGLFGFLASVRRRTII